MLPLYRSKKRITPKLIVQLTRRHVCGDVNFLMEIQVEKKSPTGTRSASRGVRIEVGYHYHKDRADDRTKTVDFFVCFCIYFLQDELQ